MAPQEPSQPDPPAEPLDEAAYADRTFTDLPFPGRTFRRQEFTGCTFERCRFAGCVFQECRFEACVFKDCDLGVIRVPNTALVDVRFEGCKMIGVDWTAVNARFLRIAFGKCVISDSTFARMDLHGIALAECVAHDCDFLGANLSGGVFRGTDFARSRFAQTDLSSADFCGATRYLIDPTMNRVKGATFSLPEAVSLLRGLGVVIR